MYSFEKRRYYDENLRFFDANGSMNENGEYIVLFQIDALQSFIDCYCKFYFSYNKNEIDDYDDDFIKMCNVFDKQIVVDEFKKIMLKYKNVKIINCMYFDWLNMGDIGLYYVMYEKQNDDNTYIDIYTIEYKNKNDKFCFKMDICVSYLFFNKYNAMKYLFNECDDDCEKIEIATSYYNNLWKYINAHNNYVSKFE